MVGRYAGCNARAVPGLRFAIVQRVQPLDRNRVLRQQLRGIRYGRHDLCQRKEAEHRSQNGIPLGSKRARGPGHQAHSGHGQHCADDDPLHAVDPRQPSILRRHGPRLTVEARQHIRTASGKGNVRRAQDRVGQALVERSGRLLPAHARGCARRERHRR